MSHGVPYSYILCQDVKNVCCLTNVLKDNVRATERLE